MTQTTSHTKDMAHMNSSLLPLICVLIVCCILITATTSFANIWEDTFTTSSGIDVLNNTVINTNTGIIQLNDIWHISYTATNYPDYSMPAWTLTSNATNTAAVNAGTLIISNTTTNGVRFYSYDLTGFTGGKTLAFRMRIISNTASSNLSVIISNAPQRYTLSIITNGYYINNTFFTNNPDGSRFNGYQWHEYRIALSNTQSNYFALDGQTVTNACSVNPQSGSSHRVYFGSQLFSQMNRSISEWDYFYIRTNTVITNPHQRYYTALQTNSSIKTIAHSLPAATYISNITLDIASPSPYETISRVELIDTAAGTLIDAASVALSNGMAQDVVGWSNGLPIRLNTATSVALQIYLDSQHGENTPSLQGYHITYHTPTKPAAPGLNAFSNNMIALTWTAVTDSLNAGYRIYYDTNSGAPYTNANGTIYQAAQGASPITLGPTVTAYTLSGLPAYQTYHFALTAYQTPSVMESSFSIETNIAVVSNMAIEQVTNCRAVQIGTQALISWSPTTQTGTAGYLVYYGRQSGGPYNGTWALQGSSPLTNGHATNITLDLPIGRNYYFIIVVTNSNGSTGSPSVETHISRIRPPTPRNFTLHTSPTSIDLSWSSVGGAGGYRIHYGQSPSLASNTDVSVTNYSFLTLTSGIEYYFAVTALDTQQTTPNESLQTIIMSGTMNDSTPLPNINAINCQTGNKIITLSWGHSSWGWPNDYGGYILYINNDGSTNYTGQPAPLQINGINITSPYTNFSRTTSVTLQVVNDIPYYFTVKALDNHSPPNINTNYAPQIRAHASGISAAPPHNLRASLQDKNIILYWDPPDEGNITGYYIYYDTDESGAPYDSVAVQSGGDNCAENINSGDVIPNVTTYTLKNVSDNVPYYIALKSRSSDLIPSTNFSEEITVFARESDSFEVWNNYIFPGADPIITIHFDIDNDIPCSVKIVDTLGVVIAEPVIHRTMHELLSDGLIPLRFDTSALNNDVYYIYLIYENKSVIQQVIIAR